jgi:UDP-N-acetyl-D-mannosaminuronate dehydrogenase
MDPTSPKTSWEKILVIGLGQLGLPVAKYVKDRGFDVYGYEMFLNSSISVKSKILEAAIEADNEYRRYRGDDRGRSISNLVLTRPRTASYIDK